jgi:serine protein kinase
MQDQESRPRDGPAVSLAQRLEELRRQEEALAWRGTFAEYYDLVRANPRIARLSHARVYDMIMAAGVQEGGRQGTEFGFFNRDLFGLHKALGQLVDYFASAAKRLEVRKRILLLMGPVGGGKSTIVTLLKRGLEAYTRTPEGAVYGIVGCPMHEEPLHLVPQALRADILKEDGIYIEGDLCPLCRWRLREEWQGDITRVPVERIFFSEKDRVGIGTFTPSDEKSQDISELVGSVDLSTVGRYGTESDPRAYRFDGEFNVANRGLVEMVEMLKCQEEFLYGLLTLTQEQSIKTARFAMIYADEVVISHTNESEYNAFIADPKNEALRDRMVLVRVPYNLRVSDEVRIYEKLLAESGVRGVHIAPHTLRVASIFAVLTRLSESKKAGMSPMKKLKLYDGQQVEGFGEGDVKELQEEAEREGMEGISPRYVINRLSSALSREGITCLGPLDALRALKDGLEQHTGLTRERREAYLNLIYEARKEYDEIAKTEVHKAFVYSYEESARTLWSNYLDNVEAYWHHEKLRDPLTGETMEPDEKLMRSIEEQIGVTENAKRAFREEILIRLSSLARRGQSFDYRTHERLREAIEKKLFADLRNVVKITTSTKTPDAEQLRKINEVSDRLCAEHGYCPVCANELIRYVGQLLNR